jgi:hypothetical protein
MMTQKPCPSCGCVRYNLRANSDGMFNASTPCYRCNGTGYVTVDSAGTTGSGTARRDTEPLFPWLDQLVARIPKRVHWIGTIITGAIGYGYGFYQDYHGQDQIVPIALGMFAWPVGLALLVLVVKGAFFSPERVGGLR